MGEKVTRLAVKVWDDAYKELAAELKFADLAAEVVKAAASDPTLGWAGWDDPATAGKSEAPDLGSAIEDDDPTRWHFIDGWRPGGFAPATDGCRTTLLASILPEACAVVRFGDVDLLSTREKGVHVVAIPPKEGATAGEPPKMRSFLGFESESEAVKQWAKSLPEGSQILIAIVEMRDTNVAAVFKSVASCLGPAALSPLPRR